MLALADQAIVLAIFLLFQYIELSNGPEHADLLDNKQSVVPPASHSVHMETAYSTSYYHLRKLTLALPTPKLYPCPRWRTAVPLSQFLASATHHNNHRTPTPT